MSEIRERHTKEEQLAQLDALVSALQAVARTEEGPDALSTTRAGGSHGGACGPVV